MSASRATLDCSIECRDTGKLMRSRTALRLPVGPSIRLPNLGSSGTRVSPPANQLNFGISSGSAPPAWWSRFHCISALQCGANALPVDLLIDSKARVCNESEWSFDGFSISDGPSGLIAAPASFSVTRWCRRRSSGALKRTARLLMCRHNMLENCEIIYTSLTLGRANAVRLKGKRAQTAEAIRC